MSAVEAALRSNSQIDHLAGAAGHQPLLSGQPEFLKRFPLVVSANAEEFGNAVVTSCAATKAYAPDPEGFNGHINRAVTQSLRLGFVAANLPIVTAYAETSDFRQRFILSGAVETTIGRLVFDGGASNSVIVSPGQSAHCRFSGHLAQLVLVIDPDAMERKLAALLGAKPGRKLHFVPTPDYAAGYSHHLRDLVFFLARQLDTTAPWLPPLLLQELEQAVIVGFLSVNEHTFSRQLHQDKPHATLREVQRAEDYIEANWSRAIDIEELANVTQVSVRNLFRSFRKTRGYSPMAFVRMLRLKHVKQMLDAGGTNTTVTGAALSCGFQNAGHFARQYREMFGELPSTTLARAQAVKDD